MAQVLLHHLPLADPGLFIGDICHHYDSLWDAIDNEPVNFRQRRRVPDGVRARPLEDIRGELSVEQFMGAVTWWHVHRRARERERKGASEQAGERAGERASE